MIPSEVDFKIKSKSSIIIVGSSHAGKSTFILENLVANAHNVFTDPPKKVVYIYTVYQPLFNKYKNQGIHFTDSLKDLVGHLDENSRTLIIIDDCQLRITDPSSLETINFLFCMATNHLNLTLCLVMHSWTAPKLKLSMNQASYILYFRVRDQSSLIQLGRECFPYERGFVMNCYRKATARKYKPVILDLHMDSDTPHIRNSLYPEPDTEIYFPSYA